LLLGFLESKPCPQYVPGGVGLVAAGQASELRLGDAVACCGVPAVGAPLGGVTGVDCDHCPSAQPEQAALEALRILDDQNAGHLRRPVHMLLGSELLERGSG
jgi:hypothetical protein